MAEHGHGSHWECVADLENVLQNVLPSMVQKGTKIETNEIFADCFEDKSPTKTKVFSITDEEELTAKILVATNQEEQSNEVVSSYPYIQSENSIRLTITAINEWQNLFEAVVTGETEDGHSISFFDTKYFLNKESYQIGEVYDFSIFALGYYVEILKKDSISFEGQKAIDWLAKTGREPNYDEDGNIEPVVIYLNEFVVLLPTDEDYPDDSQFQSPIKDIQTIKAFDKEFYKIKITIFRDPDIEIDLYAKTSFFEKKPQVKDAIQGIIWLQGYKQ